MIYPKRKQTSRNRMSKAKQVLICCSSQLNCTTFVVTGILN
ncbi:Protein of unknown function [Lactobacillus equicursoris DSM 19284 = JCM 14600 = CIP 110162]|nr:Protein of unknown function [Lactobacillus equicursoris DSM 19284 = JCM 14600 = CIP 110162]